jgi:hypothetical protein
MKLDGLPTAEVWICEDLGLNGGIAQSAIALSLTERIRVGHGIARAAIRNVAHYAMEVASLCRTFPRFPARSRARNARTSASRETSTHCLPAAT